MNRLICFLFFLIIEDLEISSSTAETLDKPLILWWYDTLFPHIEDEEKDLYDVSCNDGSSCHASRNRGLLDTVGAASIMFYGSDFQPDDLPLPRKKNHIWALLHEESPMNSFLLLQGKVLELFNYSATFKTSSDYPLTTQYIPSIDYLMMRAPISIKEKNRYRKQGLAPAVYIQSNCDVPSDRDRYVSMLMQHMAIDSYGECLNNKDFNVSALQGMENLHNSDFLGVLAKYKFHIAFENAICDDYITEKLYRSFHVGSVPIYMGAANVDKWSPSNSVIKVSDFSSPESLSRFVKNLDNDDDQYLAYFEYKQNQRSLPNPMREAIQLRKWSADGDTLPHFVDGFECFVCAQMHKLGRHNEITISKFPNHSVHINASCQAPKPSVSEKLLHGENDKLDMWIAQYAQSAVLSDILSNIVQRNATNSAGVWDILATTMMNAHSEL